MDIKMAKKQLFLFGSTLCPDCGPAKTYLEKKGVTFRYFNITENLGYLKFLLKYRDERPEFEEVKRDGKIGIPCLMIGDGEKFIFDVTTADLSEWI